MSCYDETREPDAPPEVWREHMTQKLAQAFGMTISELQALRQSKEQGLGQE